ncbi:hypothetical protein GSI_09814 [Ganoderma sinense ZZ0214-1]|uniref:Uncharacterized protein n=1 Tax=Ganoderma sinense ZZ0214-1 TaxID=1077348 RepID=A0A2G8S2T5_9APHY|nr:hypothetical protein GSI_09814 [Ganoderma sinense ZZ0214-1]
MSQTTSSSVKESDITNGLVAGLYGVLVVLSIQAFHALTQSWRTQPAAIFLSLTVLALFTSTTLYVVVTIIYNEAFYLDDLLSSAVDLWEIYPFPDFNSETSVWSLQKDYTWLYQKAGTATVMINIILGDAIVCWRACVIWGRNRVVQAVCALFVSATFVLGVLDATLGSRTLFDHGGAVVVLSGQPGALFEDNSFGIATCVLSLTTNLVATLLIAYKAWKARRRLQGYFVAKAGGSQAEKLFAILIESGAVYCAIWTVVVAYQISNYQYNQSLVPGPNSQVQFLDIFGVIMNGGLVPVIAIYPTFIIVLVASNKSHVENGLIRSTHSIPTFTYSGDTSTTARSENPHARRSSVLLISREHQDCEDSMDEASRSTDTREEWKLERLI